MIPPSARAALIAEAEQEARWYSLHPRLHSNDHGECSIYPHEADETASLLGRLVAALAEADPAPQESAWQPIATAPKMRKLFVSYINDLGKRRVVLACYYTAKSLEMHDDYAEVGEYDEATGDSFAPVGWYEEHDNDNPLMPIDKEPTHWMPLPAPPVPDEERQP